jgi:hypothetical protein
VWSPSNRQIKDIFDLEVIMRNRRFFAGLFVFSVLLIQGCTVVKPVPGTPTAEPTSIVEIMLSPSPVPDITASPVPTKVIPPVSLEGFSGNWIGYNVVSLEPGQEIVQKPGIHLEISKNHYSVDGTICSDPVYETKKINLTDFFEGKNPPTSSIELNDKEVPFLSTNCSNLVPASLANVNPRTLAAVIGSDLLYFESDNSRTENGMSIVSNLVAETNKEPLYEIHAQVPVLKIPENEKFNRLAQSIVSAETDGYHKNFTDWEIPAEMAGYTSFMWIGYDVPLLTPDLVSIRFSVDYYMAGAAHPNHYFKVLNYDLKADKEITFGDLFINENQSLSFLSKASKTSLTKADFPLFDDGLKPRRENFINWNLTKDSLRISFDPYQVAPYAAGPQEVLVPFSDIKKQVNLNTTVGAFIAR